MAIPTESPDPRRRHRSGAGGGDHAASSTRPASASNGRSVDAGEARHRRATGRRCPDARPRVDPAQPGRRSRARSRPRSATGSAASTSRSARRSACTPTCARPARCKGVEIALRGRRPRHRPREHRGPLRRHRAHGRPRRGREHQDHHPRGVRADRPVRLRLRGRQRPAQGHGRAQGQHHEAVRRPVPRELPDGRRRLRRAGSSSRTASSTTCACSSSRSRTCTTCSCCPNLYGDIVSDLAAGPRRRPRRRARREHRHRGRRLRAGPRLGAEVRRPRSAPTRPR